MSKPRRILFALTILALLALGIWLVIPGIRLGIAELNKRLQQENPGLYTVVKVDDGDTIVVRDSIGNEDVVRFLGIDTPEVKDPRKPVQCYGVEASNETKKLLTGQKVRLEADPQNNNRDKYQRLLRYIYRSDGLFVNEYLIEKGFAMDYLHYPLTKLERFRELGQVARESGVGLWGACTITESKGFESTNAVE